jgi:hypothetical protein
MKKHAQIETRLKAVESLSSSQDRKLMECMNHLHRLSMTVQIILDTMEMVRKKAVAENEEPQLIVTPDQIDMLRQEGR